MKIKSQKTSLKLFQKTVKALQEKTKTHSSNCWMYAVYGLAFVACSVKGEASMIESLGASSTEAMGIVDGPLGYVAALLGTGVGLWGAIQKGSLMMAGVVILIVCAIVYNVDMLKSTFVTQ